MHTAPCHTHAHCALPHACTRRPANTHAHGQHTPHTDMRTLAAWTYGHGHGRNMVHVHVHAHMHMSHVLTKGFATHFEERHLALDDHFKHTTN